MTEKNRIKGKKARAAGQRFEIKVRNDLEEKGWIVDKWSNNLEIVKYDNQKGEFSGEIKLVKVKNKFRGPGIPMMLGAGFPDFIAFKLHPYVYDNYKEVHTSGQFTAYEIIGVEVKSNGRLDKTEKEKCKWLLDNNIFSKILIASKGEKRGQIKYIEFGEKE